MHRSVLSVFLLCSIIFRLEAKEEQIFLYTISVCSSVEYKNALNCVDEFIPQAKEDIYIIQDGDGLYKTLYGAFSSYEGAQEFSKGLSKETNSQGPFIKKLSYNLKNPNNYLEKIKVAYKAKKPLMNIDELIKYEQVIISVDSASNKMTLEGLLNGKPTKLKEYKVSTAKKDVQKPQGIGGVTSISLEPHWYPTQDIIKQFKETKKIDLPSVVPYGHPQNYMGSAKINLTHKVDGKNTFRIHGTINEKTIGRNESSGCIRMKNDEVLELAKMLQKFSDEKKMKNIKVVLE